MEALDLLLNRYSCNQLIAPAPDAAVLENILQAALRSPDHGALTPWRFIVSEGEGLKTLGSYYREAAAKRGMPEKDIAKAQSAPLRAPMIITVVTKVKPHNNVPEIEQIASAGCTVLLMQMAAQAQGFNGIWRTGWFAYDEHIKAELGLSCDDIIVGYLYLGTPNMSCKKIRQLDVSNFVTNMK